jgi:hypothetical protein
LKKYFHGYLGFSSLVAAVVEAIEARTEFKKTRTS